MNSADKPHWDADSSVSSVLRRSPVFRISKSFLSKFITPSSLHVGLGPVGDGEVRRLRLRTFWRLLGYPLLPRRGPGRRGVEILEGTIGKRVPVDTEETLVAGGVRDDAGQDTELDLIKVSTKDLRLPLGVPKVLPPFSSLIESLKMRVRS